MRDAVLVYFQLPPRMFKTLGAPPRRGAARVRPLPQFVHAPEPFQRRRRVLRADIEALGVAMLGKGDSSLEESSARDCGYTRLALMSGVSLAWHTRKTDSRCRKAMQS